MWPFSLAAQFAWFSIALTPIARQPQQSAERAFFDSLLVQLAATGSVADLPSSRCVPQPKEIAKVCESLITVRKSEITQRRDDGLAAEDAMERAVVDRPKSAAAWFGLAQVRLRLSRDTAFARGGALMPVGTSYRSGQVNALIEALKVDPTFVRAAEQLINTPMTRTAGGTVKDRVAIFRKVRGILSPANLAAVADLERDAGSVDSAMALEERALASGQVDVGLVSLGLARDLYRIGQPAQGRSTLFKAASNPTAATKDAYHKELTWVASPKELIAWDSLPPADRPAWLADFWQKRDIAEGRKDGARLVEHFKRIEFAMKNFRVQLPENGRQKMLSHMASATEDEGAARNLAMKNPDCFPDAARLANDDELIGAHTPFPYYKPIQDQVDDRGIIWIRHGEPTVRGSNVRVEAAEVWRYNLSPEPLIVQFREVDFDGQIGASTLTPTLLSASPALRANLCWADPELCHGDEREAGLSGNGAMRATVKSCGVTFFGRNAGLVRAALTMDGEAHQQFVSTNAIIAARDAGRAQIDRAITTDSYLRDFSKVIVPGVQIFGLDRVDGMGPRIVVAFALPRDQLTPVKAPNGPTSYAVSIQIMASNAAGERIDVDTIRTFTTSTPRGKGEFFTGLIEVPTVPGGYHVSLVVSQADGKLGLAHLENVRVPATALALMVSDLVLGREGGSVTWNSGAIQVPLNPLNTYPAGSAAAVYFQLSGLSVGASYKTSFEFYRPDDDPKKGPRLVVASDQIASAGRMEIARSLGLGQLEAGKYLVKLIVTGAGATATAAGWLTIVR